MSEPVPPVAPKVRRATRRDAVVAAVSAVIAALAVIGVPAVTGGDTTPTALAAAVFVPPSCDAGILAEECQDLRIAALEADASGVTSSPTQSATESATPSESATETPTPSESATPTPSPSESPTATPSPTPTQPAAKALLGMSAPVAEWAQRVREVGDGLQARRIFVGSFTGSLNLAATACSDGMTPIVSFKTGNYSWAQVGSGAADADLRSLAAKLSALACPSFVAVHHEPSNDGAATDFTRMQARALPILGGALGGKVQVGVIGNGWWYNSNAQGLSDAELDQWVGPSVRAVSDFIAADTYQPSISAEGVASKINRQGAWAARVNAATPNTPVRGIGQGEWNVQSAQAVTDACNAAAAQPLNKFSSIWNNDGTGSANAHILTGAMLQAFRDCLADW